jgi:hypothetical protein
MDKGAQKMKPIATDDERKITVEIFANGCYDGTIKITSYEPMLIYLKGKHVKILYDKLLPRTADFVKVCDVNDAKLYLEWLKAVVRSSEKASEDVIDEAYNQLDRFILALRDVTKYDKEIVLMKPYDWVTRLEKFENEVSEDLLGEMKDIHDSMEFWERNVQGYNDQLDDLIEKIDDKTEALSEANEKQMSNVTKMLQSIAKTNEKQMDDITKMLESIARWMEKYSPILDGMKKDYKTLHPRKLKK